MKKKIVCILLSFFIPILIFYFFSIFRYGNTFLYRFYDVSFQYIPLFKFFKGFLLSDNSLFYSFFKGLGGNMFSTFFYYLSSPLNVLLIFFDDIISFFNIILLIKIGLCGLFMYLYLNDKYSEKYIFNLIFSWCYALMGYNLIFINNIFWYDVVYIAPIVMFGIDRIINDKGIFVYVISLFYAIICNFYIAFSLGIFSLIYFVYNLFIFDFFNKKYVKKFVLSTILIIFISSFMIVPTLFDILNLNSRSHISNFFNYDLYNIPYLLYKFLIGSSNFLSNSIMFSNSPNIYCSILCLVLNLAYFSNNKISNKEKIITLCVYLFFILSMVISPLYMFWHGLSNTNGYYYRFSFLWSFFRIIIAYKSLINISYFRINKPFVLFIVTYCLLFVFAMFFGSYSFYFHGIEIFISLLFIIVYIILIYYRYFKIILFVVLIELSLNVYFCYTFDIVPGVGEVYKIDYDNYCLENVDNNFFRAEFKNYNNGLYCNYGTISSYLSTCNDDLNNFLFDTGLMEHLMYLNSYYYSTDLLYDIFGIKYIDLDGKIVKNDDALSIGYLINNNSDAVYAGNPLFYQQEILNSMIGTNYEFFSKIDLVQVDELNFYFINDYSDKYVVINDNYKVLLDINPSISKLKTNKVSFKVFRFFNSNDSKIDINLKINCDIKNEKCIPPSITLYNLNYNILKEAIDILKEQQLNVTKINKNILEGNIEVKKDNQYLFLSIPYEKGWHIYVDGKKVKYEKLFDAFIGIKLNKGYHEIKMKFYPQGLNIGIIISFVSLILIIIYIKKNK